METMNSKKSLEEAFREVSNEKNALQKNVLNKSLKGWVLKQRLEISVLNVFIANFNNLYFVTFKFNENHFPSGSF